MAIIGQHINTPPVAPSWHRADCPRPLEALVLRLLAKDPTARPESAADVLAALAAIDADRRRPRRARRTRRAQPRRARERRLRRPRKELETLRAALEEALSGHGRLVMLVGEPGIGKTRTATELTTYARLRGAQVLWGRCYETAGRAALLAVRPGAARLRPRARPGAAPARARQHRGRRSPRSCPSSRTKLPGLAPLPPAEPAQARFRLFDSVTAFLRAASADEPLVLVLDDLHWADAGTLALLEFLARELEGAACSSSARTATSSSRRAIRWRPRLAELTRERLFERVLLRGLDAEDVGRFIAGTAGITPPGGARATPSTRTPRATRSS